jgi:hypothetical protein
VKSITYSHLKKYTEKELDKVLNTVLVIEGLINLAAVYFGTRDYAIWFISAGIIFSAFMFYRATKK